MLSLTAVTVHIYLCVVCICKHGAGHREVVWLTCWHCFHTFIPLRLPDLFFFLFFFVLSSHYSFYTIRKSVNIKHNLLENIKILTSPAPRSVVIRCNHMTGVWLWWVRPLPSTRTTFARSGPTTVAWRSGVGRTWSWPGGYVFGHLSLHPCMSACLPASCLSFILFLSCLYQFSVYLDLIFLKGRRGESFLLLLSISDFCLYSFFFAFITDIILKRASYVCLSVRVCFTACSFG